MKTLHLVCEDGEPGILNWTVPLNAPDTLYYQVWLHHSSHIRNVMNQTNDRSISFTVFHTQESGMENYCRRQWNINGIVKHSCEYIVFHCSTSRGIDLRARIIISALIVALASIPLIAINWWKLSDNSSERYHMKCRQRHTVYRKPTSCWYFVENRTRKTPPRTRTYAYHLTYPNILRLSETLFFLINGVPFRTSMKYRKWKLKKIKSTKSISKDKNISLCECLNEWP